MQSPDQRNGVGGPLRAIDWIVVAAGGSGAFILSAFGPATADASQAIAVLLVLAVAPLVLRYAARRNERTVLVLLSDWFPALSIPVAYAHLGPILDALHRPLADPILAAADERLFGVVPSVWFASRLPDWIADVLVLCYASFFFWLIGLAVLLYLRRDRSDFEQYALAVVAAFFINFVLYILVPAVGPRVWLAGEFATPRPGGWFGGAVWSAFFESPFQRDCFPSGHTALTLLALTFAWRKAPRFFAVMLPFALGLMASTVLLRFHYVVDVLAAPPLTAVAVLLGSRVRQRGEAERLPQRSWGAPEPAQQ